MAGQVREAAAQLPSLRELLLENSLTSFFALEIPMHGRP